jgi:uncharacterized membrane protein YGL010W
MPNGLFNRQLASYAAVHCDMRNRATHFVGIPVIVFSLRLVFPLCLFTILDREISASFVVAVLAVLAGWRSMPASAPCWPSSC